MICAACEKLVEVAAANDNARAAEESGVRSTAGGDAQCKRQPSASILWQSRVHRVTNGVQRKGRVPTATALSCLLTAGLLASNAMGRSVTITVTGTVDSGVDGSGVFGPPGGEIAGKRFILIFTFDDAKGQQQPAACGPGIPECRSQIAGSGAASPGIATLQIGESAPYMFGNGSGDNISSYAKRMTTSCCYTVMFDVRGDRAYVGGGVGNVYPRKPATKNADWRVGFSDLDLRSIPSSPRMADIHAILTPGGFRFRILAANGGIATEGQLAPQTICEIGTGSSSAEPYKIMAGGSAKVVYPRRGNEYPVNLKHANCYGFAFGGAGYWGAMYAPDAADIIRNEFDEITGRAIQKGDRIVYGNPIPNLKGWTPTHAQIVFSAPAGTTDAGDPAIVVDSREGPDDRPPGWADRYHGPANTDCCLSKIVHVYRLKPCDCRP